MDKIATFEKVSFQQYKKDIEDIFGIIYSDEELEKIYNDIELPSRSTSGSAGYDFKSPIEIFMHKSDTIVIPTGIKSSIKDGWMLSLYPRSGLGFKYGLRLCNTVGIIDSDYYYSNNEGHIMAKIDYSYGDFTLNIKKGERFMQGVFLQYGITTDDNTSGIRNGGIGSTGK